MGSLRNANFTRDIEILRRLCKLPQDVFFRHKFHFAIYIDNDNHDDDDDGDEDNDEDLSYANPTRTWVVCFLNI